VHRAASFVMLYVCPSDVRRKNNNCDLNPLFKRFHLLLRKIKFSVAGVVILFANIAILLEAAKIFPRRGVILKCDMV